MAAIGYVDYPALDCPDPLALARFYQVLVGGDIIADDGASDDGASDDGAGEDAGDWVELRVPRGSDLAFQRARDFVPPTWPEPGVPQQMHLDLRVQNIDIAERAVLAAGAIATGYPHPAPGESPHFRVYLDPVGHPFCLCWPHLAEAQGPPAPGWLGNLE